MVTKKQLKNLQPFSKGISGNPRGKPKGSKHLSTILGELLQVKIKSEDFIEEKCVKQPVGRIIILELIRRAKEGDLKAIGMILDRLEGKAVQKTEITNHEDELLNIREITENMTYKEAAEIFLREIKNPNISKAIIEKNKSKCN